MKNPAAMAGSILVQGGLWLAAPETYTPGAEESRLTLLVSERCTQE